MSDRLRDIVKAAMSGRWRVDGGTGSEVFDVVNHANVGILDNGLYEHALFAATFDPVVVAALLDVYEGAKFIVGDPYLRYAPGMGSLTDAVAVVDRLIQEDTDSEC